MNRILSLIIAVALLGLAPVAAGATTAPTTGAAAARVSTGPTTAAREQLPKREITSKVVNATRTKLIFKGKVKGQPKYSKKVVKIQRKLGKHKAWKPYAKVKTDKKGRWRHQIGFPRHGYWYWRAMTPKTGQYGKSFSGTWRTYAI